jgi:hypothetical protein
MKNLVLLIGLILLTVACNPIQITKSSDAYQIKGGGENGAAYDTVADEGIDLAQQSKINFIGTAIECADNEVDSRTDCTISVEAGSAHNLLSESHSDTVESSPTLGALIYGNVTPAWELLTGNSTTDKLFLTQIGTGSASAAPSWAAILDGDIPSNIVRDTRTIGTTAPLGGGGDLSGNLTITCLTCVTAVTAASPLASSGGTTPEISCATCVTAVTGNSPITSTGGTTPAISCSTCEVTSNKNQANGYAGLDSSSKITASQIQEVIAVADLTDYDGKSGSGSTSIGATVTSPQTNDVLTWNGSNWVNQAPSGNGGSDPLTGVDVVDDFLSGSIETGEVGVLGWEYTSATAPTFQNSIANHPGIFRIATSTSSGNIAFLRKLGLHLANATWEQTYIVRIPTITSITIRVGLSASATTVPATENGMSFFFDPATSANWITRSGNGTSQNTTTTGIAAAGNTFFKLRIKRNANNIEFYINDSLVDTDTSNLPTSNAAQHFILARTNTTASRTLDIDFFRGQLTVSR